MFLTDAPTFVLLAGAALAAISALVLIWRFSARQEAGSEVSPRMRPADNRSAHVPEAKRPVPASPEQQVVAPRLHLVETSRPEPVTGSGLSYTEIAAAAAATAARPGAHHGSLIPAAPTMPSGDDPYGVRASLPPGASYTEIAVATAEAARRAQAGAGTAVHR